MICMGNFLKIQNLSKVSLVKDKCFRVRTLILRASYLYASYLYACYEVVTELARNISVQGYQVVKNSRK